MGHRYALPQWLIAGLGNPGDEYRATRHNLGFWAVDELAVRAGVPGWSCVGPMARAMGNIGTVAVALVKPLRWMNRSGPVLSAALSEACLPLERLVVMCDDVALPDGRTRIRMGGSCGGHKGLASTIDAMGSDGFVRVRIGVGSSWTAGDDLSLFVLRPLTDAEQAVYAQACKKAIDVVEGCIVRGLFTSLTVDSMTLKPMLEEDDHSC